MHTFEMIDGVRLFAGPAVTRPMRLKPFVQVHLNDGGIGDQLCALACAEGLRRATPGVNVVFVGRADRMAWVNLFAGKIVTAPEAIDGGARIDLDIHVYDRLLQERRARWEYWGQICGVKPVPPDGCCIPDADLEWAQQYRDGYVALSPFAAHAVRCWPIQRWLEVERLLYSRGLRTVVLDDQQGRLTQFKGEQLVSKSPSRVVAVIQTATAFAGNDSGMTHVAGMLRRPAVAVCSGASDHRIFDLYPTVRSLGGRSGGGLFAVQPDAVFSTVESMFNDAAANPDPFPADKLRSVLAERDRGDVERRNGYYTVLWRLLRQLRPWNVVEIGVRAGYSAWLTFEACPGVRVHGIDIDGDFDGGYKGAVEHARTILAERDFTLQIADSQQLDKIPTCDLAYVDGCHTRLGCHNDLILAEQSGAQRILVDDYGLQSDPGVKEAVDAFMAVRSHLKGSVHAYGPAALYLIERRT